MDPDVILQLIVSQGPSTSADQARAMEESFTSHLQLPSKEEMEAMLIERRKQVRRAVEYFGKLLAVLADFLTPLPLSTTCLIIIHFQLTLPSNTMLLLFQALLASYMDEDA